jgi:hypothetical protein
MLGRAAAQQCYLEALRLDMLYAPAWRGLGDLLRESGELVQVRSNTSVLFMIGPALSVPLLVSLLCMCLLDQAWGLVRREG